MPKRTARQEIERAFHVSFKLPEQAAELLDAYRAEVLADAAEMLINANPDRSPEFSDGVDWAHDLILNAAAGGAR